METIGLNSVEFALAFHAVLRYTHRAWKNFLQANVGSKRYAFTETPTSAVGVTIPFLLMMEAIL